MSSQNLGPLDWRIPIVTPDGRVTPEFQRRWATQIANNSEIGDGVQLGSGPPPALPVPSDGAMYVDTSGTPYIIYVASGGVWTVAGVGSDDPTAIASDTAVNGTAATFMRSDASPAIQKATDSQFGVVQVDGTTITESGGIISSVGGGSGGLVFIRLAGSPIGATQTFNVNSTAYINSFAWEFLMDLNEFPFTDFRISLSGQSNAVGQTVTLQLTESNVPGTPIHTGGNDLVVTNTFTSYDSGWRSRDDGATGSKTYMIAIKGSNATVDFSFIRLDILLRV